MNVKEIERRGKRTLCPQGPGTKLQKHYDPLTVSFRSGMTGVGTLGFLHIRTMLLIEYVTQDW